MHIDSWTQRKPSFKGAGALACGVLTLGLLSGATLSQDGGGGQQGGNQGGGQGGKGGAETAPARQREQPGEAKGDVGGKLADQLGRLHEEFKDQFRSALVDADVGRFGKPVADELVVTMFQGLVVAGYPVEPGSEGTPGAGASGGDNGRETGAGGQAGGAGSQAGGAGGQGNAGARGGQEATATKADGQLIGVVIVGGTDGSNRPASHAGAVEAGSDRNADGHGANGRIGEGSYGVFLMTPNMVALRREDGTTVRTLQIRHDAGGAQPEHAGGASGEARSPGQGEKGEKGEGGVGTGGQRPANDTASGHLPSDFRPDWSRVYLAVLMEIDPGEGPHHDAAGGTPKH